jgi:ADP-heptose:LPS heptosyltransferase
MAAGNLPPSHRLGELPPRRVLLFRALQLGDLLCAVPAFRALRSALPQAHLTLVGLPWAETFVERYRHYLDDFIPFPGYPGLPEQAPRLEELPGFLSAVQKGEYDLALQMHGSGELTNPLVALFGARRMAGFFVSGRFCPDPERFLPYPQELPETWRLLRLLQFLGIPLQGEALDFPLREEDRQTLARLPGASRLVRGEYACVHPGARAGNRRWRPDCFAAVADGLAERGLAVILTGSAGEAPLVREVARTMRAPALDLAGHTDLGSLAALLAGARLLVCNDTGVSHLAAALRLPSVVVLPQMSDREAWPPRDRQRHRIVCGIEGVTPEDVLAQVDDLISNEL